MQIKLLSCGRRFRGDIEMSVSVIGAALGRVFSGVKGLNSVVLPDDLDFAVGRSLVNRFTGRAAVRRENT